MHAMHTRPVTGLAGPQPRGRSPGCARKGAVRRSRSGRIAVLYASAWYCAVGGQTGRPASQRTLADWAPLFCACEPPLPFFLSLLSTPPAACMHAGVRAMRITWPWLSGYALTSRSSCSWSRGLGCPFYCYPFATLVSFVCGGKRPGQHGTAQDRTGRAGRGRAGHASKQASRPAWRGESFGCRPRKVHRNILVYIRAGLTLVLSIAIMACPTVSLTEEEHDNDDDDDIDDDDAVAVSAVAEFLLASVLHCEVLWDTACLGRHAWKRLVHQHSRAAWLLCRQAWHGPYAISHEGPRMEGHAASLGRATLLEGHSRSWTRVLQASVWTDSGARVVSSCETGSRATV